MTTSVCFSIPARREFIGLVRLAVGGLAPVMPFDAETIEDIKLAMSEICTNIILTQDEAEFASDLVFTITIGCSDIAIDIKGAAAVEGLMTAGVETWERPKQVGYGLSIISALMDKIELVPGDDAGAVLRLKKFA